MKKYIVLTTDGVCYDNDGEHYENMQVIGFFRAPFPGAAIDEAYQFITDELMAGYSLDSLLAYELSPNEKKAL